MNVALLIPSLREHTHEEVLRNITETTPGAAVYFLGVRYPSYAKAINAGAKESTEPYLFCGADDLKFTKGWLEEALKKMNGNIQVVGTNDLHSGDRATHCLVSREFLPGTQDNTGLLMHEDYVKIYGDTELVQTARHRGVYDYAPESVVEHLHPDWDTRKKDEIDLLPRKYDIPDEERFNKRKHLWNG